jgi:hypothetical protein
VQTVFLGRQHLDELPAAGQQCAHVLRLLIGQCARCGVNGLGEMGQNLRVELVGLGELAGGLGKLAHLARIDHGDRQTRHRERGSQRQFQATRGLHDDQRWLQILQLLHQLRDLGLAIAGPHRFAAWAARKIQMVLGDVDADERLYL